MTKPESIDRVEWLKYDTRLLTDVVPNWQLLRYLPPESFIDMMHQYGGNEDYIENFDHIVNGFTLHFTYRNDQGPTYYTTFDDDLIFFDSYDAEVDTTLQASKTIGFGFKATEFEKLDTYVPNLQPQQFALLLNESKSLAWSELKQTVHQKAEVSARRNWRHLQKTRQAIPDGTDFRGNHNFDTLPNFARNR